MSITPICSKEEVRVSDHVVLRYLERAMGFNIEIVREHILSICGNAAAIGATAVRSEGLRFEIADGVIVTVVPDQTGPSRISRERAQEKMQRGAA